MDTTETKAMQEFRQYMADPAARQAFVEAKARHAESGVALRYSRILALVGSRPWAIEEAMFGVIVDVLTFRAYGGRMTAEEIEARVAPHRREPSRQAPQGVARVPVSGVLVPRAGSFDEMSGGTSAATISDNIAAAVASPQVGSIVLDIDSPGGMVDGIPELAAQIQQAREVKPVIAVANTEALSAAYWLASQADKIIASPSARVGSIGVLSTHKDESAKAEKDGVRTTIVSAGKYKAEANPFGPLSDEALAHLQAQVNAYYDMFVEAVAEGRGVTAAQVRTGFGQGRFGGVAWAAEQGLIDGVDTIDNVIRGELARLNTAGPATAAAATTLSVDPGTQAAVASVSTTNTTNDALQKVQAQISDSALAKAWLDQQATKAGNPEDPREPTPPQPEHVDDPLPDPEPTPTENPEPGTDVVDPAPDPEPEPEPANAEADSMMAELAALKAPAAAAPTAPPYPITRQEREILTLQQMVKEADEGALPPGLERETLAVVDNSAWDGNRAMGQCSTASDYRSICAGEHTEGSPDERQHWALPHHYLGRGPNAAGVRNALSRLPQTKNLANEAAAQRHLDAHMREIDEEGAKAEAMIEGFDAIQAELAALRLGELSE